MTSKEISIFRYRDLTKSLARLQKRGGRPQKVAQRIYAWLGHPDTAGQLANAKMTNHGESRVKSCVKYDLGDGFRLITVQTKNAIFLCFAGTHDEADKWLDRNRGFTPARRDGDWEVIYKTASIDQPVTYIPYQSTRPLIEQLPEPLTESLLDGVPFSAARRIMQLEGAVTSYQIEDACARISDPDKATLIGDVLRHLAGGDDEGARRLIELDQGLIDDAESLDDEELLEIRDGDKIRAIRVGSKEHQDWLDRFAHEAPYLEWLLFMHPEQDNVSTEDFSGSAQLSGVSGSGKTCVAVRRAVRLIESATHGIPQTPRIQVYSFFELCQELLHKLEPDNAKIYDDVTWKLNEHIDEIFREYYRCWNNNDAAKVLRPIHYSLTARGIFAEEYCREELDWIRSAVELQSRGRYLDLERSGRKVPIVKEWREHYLEALEHWEEKMREVGVVDYMGLSTALSRHIDHLPHRFDHLIIDEAQDFGTTELEILRRLTREGENDLFLCGDIAQHILPKHRSLPEAGIEIGNRSRKIIKNYRNTKEILKAAYAVLVDNLDEHMFDSEDLQILDPEFASRRSNEPVVLEARDLAHEFAAARSLIAENLESDPTQRCCIAIAGHSLREVEMFARQNGLPCLSGDQPPLDEPLVLSDLEQTKGYEFDTVAIINATRDALPPTSSCREEAFRYGCRLYVAMTRAKNDLYLFYHGEPSEWLVRSGHALTFMVCEEEFDIRDEFLVDPPEKLPEVPHGENDDLLALTGREFVYRADALGLSPDALTKLDELVDGTGLRRNGIRVRWQNLRDLMEDLETHPTSRNTFGPKLWREVYDRLVSVSVPR